jgi:hypothetical protein
MASSTELPQIMLEPARLRYRNLRPRSRNIPSRPASSRMRVPASACISVVKSPRANGDWCVP